MPSRYFRALRSAMAIGTLPDRKPYLGIAPVTFADLNAVFDANALALPSTVQEVQSIAALMSSTMDDIFLSDAASEAFVRETDLSKYEVISIATHALLSDEARSFTDGAVAEPALLLRSGAGQDGVLTASEVATLHLNAEWVLLSACNTGAGGGANSEGLTGLARAFFFAGAKSLMVSYWYVDDRASMNLMVETIRNSTIEKLGRSKALRQAILLLKNSSGNGYAHPFFWASFSVVGDNR